VLEALGNLGDFVGGIAAGEVLDLLEIPGFRLDEEGAA